MFHKSRYRAKWFTIAIDGSGVVSFSHKHCDQCLHKTTKDKDGNITNYTPIKAFLRSVKPIIGLIKSTFKDGNLPTVWQEVEGLGKLQIDNEYKEVRYLLGKKKKPLIMVKTECRW